MENLKSKNSFNEGCFPCTIHQLIKLKNDGTFNGKLIKQVELNARFLEQRKNSFTLECTFEDITGRIVGVFYYLKESDKYYGITDKTELKLNKYYSIFGILRIVDEDVVVIVNKIEIIEERLKIEEFLTRVMVCLIKSNQVDPRQEIILMFRNEGWKKPEGLNLEDFLLGVPSVNKEIIEENLYQLTVQGIICYGKDWDHYCLIDN